MTSTIEAEASPESTGALWAPMDGHHCCWYPVALSSDLVHGQLKGMEFCDGNIVLYRGEDGVARVTTPYCPHMGANLSVGKVVGNDLQCAFHHWQFGPDGHCTVIPSGDRIPKSAKVFSFSVEEKWGLIWVFFGDEPLYPVPSIPHWDEEKYVTRAFRVPLSEPLHVDPWVFSTNTFDAQHFEVVHEIPALNREVTWHEWGGGWAGEVVHPTITKMMMEVNMWGVNSLVSHSMRGTEELNYVAANAPLGREGLATFLCLAAERSDRAEAVLDQQQALHSELVQEDVQILNTMRMGEALFTSSDRHLVRYLRFARNFPRTKMKELEARA